MITEQYELEGQPVQLRLSFSGDFINQILGYPVIVEAWDKRDQGRVGRAYREAFNEEERRAIGAMYPAMYSWYLRTGIPQRVGMRLRTLQLLQRAANFFASI